MNKKHCKGCRDDFYNHRVNFNGKSECWHLANAKIKTRYQIGVWTPQDKKENFTKVRKPNCYEQDGCVFYDELPEHL